MNKMKTKIVLAFIIMTSISLSIFAQKNPVDRLFDKYGGKDGFTTVYISGKMFSLISDIQDEDDELKESMSNIESIKILTTEDDSLVNPEINFYNGVIKDLEVDEYEEFMIVKEKNQDVKFLVKEENGKIVELLLLVGGKGNNAMISIRGLIDLESISQISKSINEQGIVDIEK